MRQFNLQITPSAVKENAATSLPIRMKKAEGGDPAELLIMDQIGEDWFGDGVKATDVMDFCKENKGNPINVRINSPGGFVYDGLVIYNALASHNAPVEVTIEGLAYSMASVIAMAGSKVRMFKASHFGIHRAWGYAMGNQKDMRASAEWLALIDDDIAEIYREKTSASLKQINEWMDGESDGTLFTASKALDAKFIDEVISPKSDDEDKKDAIQDGKKAMSKMGRQIAQRRRQLQGVA